MYFLCICFYVNCIIIIKNLSMKATFNFQVKIDDKQTSVVFGMEECKGVDIEVMNALMRLFSETRAKAVKLLDKPTAKEKTLGNTESKTEK